MNLYNTNAITAPDAEPVSLAELKDHARVEHDLDDAVLRAYIGAARRHTEERIDLRIVRQQWRQYIDYGFPSTDIALHERPAREIDSIKYYDGDGVLQTLATSVYTFDEAGQRIIRAYGQTYPGTRYIRNAIEITFWVGFYDEDGTSPLSIRSTVPTDLKVAIMLLATHMYEHRGTHVIGTIASELPTYEALIAPHRLLAI